MAAERFADPSESVELQDELEQLDKYMSAVVRLRGRSRTDAKAVENARASVTRLIKTAKENMREHNKDLWIHLDKHLHTGIYLHYSPEHPINWRL